LLTGNIFIEKDNSERGFKQTMFVLPKNASAELWDGPRTGVDGVKELFGADEAFDNTRFTSHLKKIISTSKTIFMDSPGTMPTLMTDDTTKKLIDTGMLSLASWKNKRLVFSKKGVCVW
jgi:intermediate cleaving peptidase 55